MCKAVIREAGAVAQREGIVDDTVRASGRDTAAPRTSIGRSSRAVEEHGHERQRGDRDVRRDHVTWPIVGIAGYFHLFHRRTRRREGLGHGGAARGAYGRFAG